MIVNIHKSLTLINVRLFLKVSNSHIHRKNVKKNKTNEKIIMIRKKSRKQKS